jgi:Predicted transcriptional regulators
MNNIDTILSIVENPTRRRILQALVREPHYPLQLSKELGISQQAVMKNLEIMEKEGLIVGKKENSSKGPEKTVYRPVSEFTITIDMRNGMFRTKMISLQSNRSKNEDSKNEDLDEIRTQISMLDEKIRELDIMRSELIDRRDVMIQKFMGNASLVTDYEMRSLLYEMLDEPDWGASEISENLRLNEGLIADMLDQITEIFTKERNEQ